jgi:hypothetical protein
MKLQLLKKTAIAAALSAFAAAASAMTPMQDDALSQVSGQDGVSIAANLNISIGSFVYTDTDTAGGSVAFQNIRVNGTVAATLDVIDSPTFEGRVFATTGAGALGVLDPTTMPTSTPAEVAAALAQGAALTAFYPTLTDVVQIAVPNIQVAAGNALNMSVAAIRMGVSGSPNTWGPSYGSFAMNNIQLQGTTAYIWAH